MKLLILKRSMSPWSFINTHSTSICVLHPDKSIFTPGSTPWIFDLPISRSCANQKHIEVNFQSIIALVKYTTFIMWPVRSINRNSYRSLLNRSCKGCTSFGVIPSCYLECSTLHFTLLLSSFIWICIQSSNTVIFDISQRVIIVSIKTAKVAINQTAVY